MLSKRGIKRHLFSGIFTAIIIGLLILSGPAKALSVNLAISDVNISTDVAKIFSLDLLIDNPADLLPISSTDLIFTSDSNSHTCSIDQNENVSGCDFFFIISNHTTIF